jgi:hypothetical protein
LAAFDSPDPQDRIALKNLLDRLQDVILASRQQLESHLCLFPDYLIQEAWEKAQPQLPLVFSPSTESTSAFRAAERPGEGSASGVDIDLIKYFIINRLLIFISTSRTLPY